VFSGRNRQLSTFAFSAISFSELPASLGFWDRVSSHWCSSVGTERSPVESRLRGFVLYSPRKINLICTWNSAVRLTTRGTVTSQSRERIWERMALVGNHDACTPCWSLVARPPRNVPPLPWSSGNVSAWFFSPSEPITRGRRTRSSGGGCLRRSLFAETAQLENSTRIGAVRIFNRRGQKSPSRERAVRATEFWLKADQARRSRMQPQRIGAALGF